jgi:hypothetical protein
MNSTQNRIQSCKISSIRSIFLPLLHEISPINIPAYIPARFSQNLKPQPSLGAQTDLAEGRRQVELVRQESVAPVLSFSIYCVHLTASLVPDFYPHRQEHRSDAIKLPNVAGAAEQLGDRCGLEHDKDAIDLER